MAKARLWLPTAVFLLILLFLCINLGWWRSSGIGPPIQVPMFYDAHYLFPRPWTQEQAAPGLPNPAYVALYGPNQLSQPFTTTAQLDMVELWLAGMPETAVSITLTTPDHSYHAQPRLTHGQTGVYYRFTLPQPLPTSAHQPLTLTIAAPSATQQQPVIVRTIGGDRLGGAVRLNEYSRPGNLDLHSYARGTVGRWWVDAVAEQLLPAVFRLRLQQFKPALFKGPAFSGLLLLLLLLTAVYLLLARPNPRRSLTAATGWGLNLLLATFLAWQLAAGRLQLPLLTPTIPLQPVAASSPTPSPNTPRLVTDLSLLLWTADRFPEPRFVETDRRNGQPIIHVPANSRLNFALTLPPNGRLQTGLGPTSSYELRWNEQPIAHGSGDQWLDIDLAPWAGQAGVLSLLTDGTTAPFWVQPQLVATADWLLPDASTAQHPTQFLFDEEVVLHGVAATPAAPGTVSTVRLFWQIRQPTDRYATVFVHLLDARGDLLAQHDGQPVGGSYPLPVWLPGPTIADDHPLPIPADLPPGDYTLAVGLYSPTDLTRWSVRDASGKLLPDGRGLIETAVSVNVPP